MSNTSIGAVQFGGVNIGATQTVNPFGHVQNQMSETVGGSITSQADTYGVTPTSGNLLLTAISIDKTSGAITIPAGFTLIGSTYVSASISGAWAYKVSDGTEGAVTWNWATTVTGGATMWLSEYSGLDTLDVQASADSGVSSVTTQTSGTTGATAQAGAIAFAIFGADTFSNVIGGRSYSNSFTEVGVTPSEFGVAGLVVSELVLSATGAQETEFSTTGAGDQMFGKIAVFNLATATGETITADAGSYTLTGADVGLVASYRLQADAGSYTLTGADVSFPTSETLTADAGSYTLTGADVGLVASYRLQADAGSYTLTGADVSFPTAAILEAEAGSYALTGADVGLVASYRLQADAGSYALTGADVQLAAQYGIVAEAGSYTLTGAAVALLDGSGTTQVLKALTADYATLDVALDYAGLNVSLEYGV